MIEIHVEIAKIAFLLCAMCNAITLTMMDPSSLELAMNGRSSQPIFRCAGERIRF